MEPSKYGSAHLFIIVLAKLIGQAQNFSSYRYAILAIASTFAALVRSATALLPTRIVALGDVALIRSPSAKVLASAGLLVQSSYYLSIQSTQPHQDQSLYQPKSTSPSPDPNAKTSSHATPHPPNFQFKTSRSEKKGLHSALCACMHA